MKKNVLSYENLVAEKYILVNTMYVNILIYKKICQVFIV